jgi:uncharacterized protein involved in type VI secretion and phage assembly
VDDLLLLETARRGAYHDSYLAQVTSVEDPESQARVQVVLSNFDGITGQDAPVWARVAVPFAGNNRGAFLIPDVGDEVLVTFVNGDSRMPVVVGSMWHGNHAPPESISNRVDRWTLVGTAGTRIAIVEQSEGQATILLTTPGEVGCTLTQSSGGKITLESAGSTVTIDTAGVKIDTPATVEVQASQVKVTAGIVKVDAGMADFSGVVKCSTLIANAVVSSSYTPGAGNVW